MIPYLAISWETVTVLFRWEIDRHIYTDEILQYRCRIWIITVYCLFIFVFVQTCIMKANSSSGDFTDCFQTTVSIWIPCGFLWAYAPFHLCHLLSRQKVHSWKHFSKLNFVKTVSHCIVVSDQTIDIIILLFSFSISSWVSLTKTNTPSHRIYIAQNIDI